MINLYGIIVSKKEVMSFYCKLIVVMLTAKYPDCDIMTLLYGKIWKKNSFASKAESRIMSRTS